VKVSGRWFYLYRAIDRDGNLLDSMLSEHRDKHAARRFLRRLISSMLHAVSFEDLFRCRIRDRFA
jgi:transposase-like protein